MKKIAITLLLTLSLFGSVQEGDKAVAFNLKALSSQKSYTMNDFKGKIVLINLWASWCGGCKKEMPEFFNLQKEMGKDFVLITINIDKNPQDAEDFLHSVENDLGYKTPFISLYDKEKSLPRAYGARGMPSSYLIDKNGIVKSVMVGSFNHEDIENLKKQIQALK